MYFLQAEHHQKRHRQKSQHESERKKLDAVLIYNSHPHFDKNVRKAKYCLPGKIGKQW